MSKIEFTIPGRIGGKGRPRATVQNGRIRAYTPGKTRDCEAMMRSFAAQAMRGRVLLSGPVKISMHIHLIPPKSWSQKKRRTALYVTGKPDADNLLKMCDAFNGIIFPDDAQIAEIAFSRRYTIDGTECVKIEVEELPGGTPLFASGRAA